MASSKQETTSARLVIALYIGTLTACWLMNLPEMGAGVSFWDVTSDVLLGPIKLGFVPVFVFSPVAAWLGFVHRERPLFLAMGFLGVALWGISGFLTTGLRIT